MAALAVGDPYGYKGKYGYYTEPSIGLILCTNRYYDSATGRWLTRDPIGYDGGMNLYAYCGDDPINAVDPSGHCNSDGGNNRNWFTPGSMGAASMLFMLGRPFGSSSFYSSASKSWQRLNWGQLNYKKLGTGTVFGCRYGSQYRDELRLDFGKDGQMTEEGWHWNNGKKSQSPYPQSNHQLIDPGGWGNGWKGKALSYASTGVKLGARAMVVYGAAVDIKETIESNDPVRTGTIKAAGWAGAWAFGQVGASAGATIGTFICPGVGTAIGGFIGGAIGGIVGYNAGQYAVEGVYH